MFKEGLDEFELLGGCSRISLATSVLLVAGEERRCVLAGPVLVTPGAAVRWALTTTATAAVLCFLTPYTASTILPFTISIATSCYQSGYGK